MPCATLTSVLLVVTVTPGVTVSTVKLGAAAGAGIAVGLVPGVVDHDRGVADVGAGIAGEGRRIGGGVTWCSRSACRRWPLVSARLKSVGASLKLKVIVAVLCARLTSVLLVVTVTVGVTVSTTKVPVLPPVPGLPLASCQVLSTTTEALPMSVPALPVKVAV